MRGMRIIGHGIDIVEVSRIAAMLQEHGQRFVTRCFTEGEAGYADEAHRRRAEHYAARFACKEAVLKALGPDGATGSLGGISRSGGGRPDNQTSF